MGRGELGILAQPLSRKEKGEIRGGKQANEKDLRLVRWRWGHSEFERGSEKHTPSLKNNETAKGKGKLTGWERVDEYAS